MKKWIKVVLSNENYCIIEIFNLIEREIFSIFVKKFICDECNWNMWEIGAVLKVKVYWIVFGGIL